MNELILKGHQIVWNGHTVWINVKTGECVCRFGVGGIDFHRTIQEQMQGQPQCLHCTHGRPNAEEWLQFVRLVKSILDIDLPPYCRPNFLGPTEGWFNVYRDRKTGELWRGKGYDSEIDAVLNAEAIRRQRGSRPVRCVYRIHAKLKEA